MSKKTNNLETLDDLKEAFFGKIGTKEKNELEEGYSSFKIGTMLLE